MVPRAVEHACGIDLGVAFHVPAHVQAQGQDRAMLLKREQDSLLAVLLAEDLVILCELVDDDPGAQRDFLKAAKRGPLRCPQQVLAGKGHGPAEDALGPFQPGGLGRLRRGLVALAAGIAALEPERLVEGPIRNQRLGDLDRLRGRSRFPRSENGTIPVGRENGTALSPNAPCPGKQNDRGQPPS